jgi:hypothetical protein
VIAMTNAWENVSHDERVHELNIARHEALGRLLGLIDMVMLAEENPAVFNMTEKLARLREARNAYNLAAAAYLDARLLER